MVRNLMNSSIRRVCVGGGGGVGSGQAFVSAPTLTLTWHREQLLLGQVVVGGRHRWASDRGQGTGGEAGTTGGATG